MLVKINLHLNHWHKWHWVSLSQTDYKLNCEKGKLNLWPHSCLPFVAAVSLSGVSFYSVFPLTSICIHQEQVPEKWHKVAWWVESFPESRKRHTFEKHVIGVELYVKAHPLWLLPQSDLLLACLFYRWVSLWVFPCWQHNQNRTNHKWTQKLCKVWEVVLQRQERAPRIWLDSWLQHQCLSISPFWTCFFSSESFEISKVYIYVFS